MKKRVLTNIKKGLSVVAMGAIVLGTSSCDREMKPVEKPEENNINFEQIYDKITTQDVLKDILNSKSIDEVKSKLKALSEKPLTIEEQSEVIKYKFKKLVKKHFAKEDEEKLSIMGVYYSENGANLILEVKDIGDTDKLANFLDELQEVYAVSQVIIPADVLDELDYTFNDLNRIDIINNSKGKCEIDLAGKFNNLDTLALSRVNVKNIPQSVTSLTFNGDLDSEYKIGNEIRQIVNLPGLAFLRFYAMKVDRVFLPIWEYPFITFENCFGKTELAFASSKRVYLENTTTIENPEGITLGNEIYVTGDISESLECIDPNNKVTVNVNIGSKQPEIISHSEKPGYVIADGEQIFNPEEFTGVSLR